MPRGDAARGAGLSSYYEPRFPSSFLSFLGSSNATTFPKNSLPFAFSPFALFASCMGACKRSISLWRTGPFNVSRIRDLIPVRIGSVQKKLRRHVNKFTRVAVVQKARLPLSFSLHPSPFSPVSLLISVSRFTD